MPDPVTPPAPQSAPANPPAQPAPTVEQVFAAAQTAEPVAQPAPALDPAKLDMLHQWFKMLDPNAQGIGLDKVRDFFPKQGWNEVMPFINALVADGRLKERPKMGKRAVKYVEYVWKAV